MSRRTLSEPKGFQRATVKQALRSLQRPGGPRRYLVADEVGLGKTVVARTIIQEMMKGRRKPLVVFYVSSNLNIAHQNRRKLLELLDDEQEQIAAAAVADRLTLAADPAQRPHHPRFHLYTLTPDTSVPMYRRRGSFGRIEERALVYRLLTGRFASLRRRWFAKFCRARRINQATWKAALNRHARIENVRELQDHFLEALNKQPLTECGRFAPDDLQKIAKDKPSHVLGVFRTALAMAALRTIQPDLIILDEFQKYRPLLIDSADRTADPVTQFVRGEQSGCRPALLLLSATPYRLYSSRRDEAAGKSHHQEFFELIRFLFGAESETAKKIEQDLLEFGSKMVAAERPNARVMEALRDGIQKRLHRVMSRTERPQNESESASVAVTHQKSELLSEDLRVFKNWACRLSESPKRRNGSVDLTSFTVPYWLSIPLPIQMLGTGYVAWNRAEKKLRRRQEPKLVQAQRDRLEKPKTWPHPQFRVLNESIATSARLALPWVAPSLPWWELQGPWSRNDAKKGKLLVFSRLKAIPPALASLLSFNLETEFAHRLRRSYRRAGEAQPLQFKSDRPMLPALFVPWPTLIASTDPRREAPNTLADVQKSMRRQIYELLANLNVTVRKAGGRRPMWQLIAALEGISERAHPNRDRPSWKELRNQLRDVAGVQVDAMRKVIRRFSQYAEAGVDSVTASEVAALAEFALSGPGVVLGRALYRFDPNCLAGERYRELLDAAWNGLRQYLNRSLFHALLARRGQSYTDAIPEAVLAGNLESVLDEHLWITSRLDADAIDRFPERLGQAWGLHEGRHRVHEPGTAKDGFMLRCHAAMPFGNAKFENRSTGTVERLRTDDLRQSFNTPFWPHVLVTTSLGQEGLDFHVWCRQLLHWDLCGSPLDVEQREGRIQRFGGLSIRAALAANYGGHALSRPGRSPWSEVAERAEEQNGDKSGLSPWWSCRGERTERMFVALPQSRQLQRFSHLSRLRWSYRLALGQPHQQDFVESVSQLPEDDRRRFALCLSAWRKEQPSTFNR